jgi:hypothetical protein
MRKIQPMWDRETWSKYCVSMTESLFSLYYHGNTNDIKDLINKFILLAKSFNIFLDDKDVIKLLKKYDHKLSDHKPSEKLHCESRNP